MAGKWCFQDGQLCVVAGAYVTPLMTLDETWLIDSAPVQVQASANPASGPGALDVVPAAKPVVALEPAAREAAKAEVKAALVKSGIPADEADTMAESAIAKARGESA